MKLNNSILFLLGLIVLSFSACDDDDQAGPSIDEPTTYAFARDGQSTVSFTGQTARILMGEELISAMKEEDRTVVNLLEMFRNETASGGDANPFDDADLNNETKSIASKVAASSDFFTSNTAVQAQIRAQFEDWITKQTTEVFPAWNNAAAAGVPGQIADGGSTRYINAQGLEYNQAVNKGLIGGLMLDQILNNYVAVSVLDAGSNVADNDAGTVVDGRAYTNMEHKWDEAYGYLYGTAANLASPVPTVGGDDSFLNKYVGRVEGDPDFAGISQRIYDAFKLGRAAIVAGNYTVRDEQAAIIRDELSKVIGVRAVYYLQQGRNGINQSTPDFGAAFHDISEGVGFIYSLQFTRKSNSNEPYFTNAEVNQFLEDLFADGANGLWDVSPATLQRISENIAERFDFTVDQAGSTN
ncbi:MAG: DUF4856 domain-containing protein [Bacteroidota bacterium]